MASSYKIVKVVQSDGHWPEVRWGFRYWQSSSLPSLAFRPTSNPSRMLRFLNPSPLKSIARSPLWVKCVWVSGGGRLGLGTITSYIAFSMANLLLGSMGLVTRKDEINLIGNACNIGWQTKLVPTPSPPPSSLQLHSFPHLAYPLGEVITSINITLILAIIIYSYKTRTSTF